MPTLNHLTGNFEVRLTGATIYSGATDLQSIFLNINNYTRAQPGFNITTGGTANAPIINTVTNPEFVSITGGTVSGGTFYSGSTPLSTSIRNIAINATPYDIGVAASDETTAITSGTTAKVTFMIPRTFNLTGVSASLTTTGSTLTTVDINKNGVSILSTKLTIDANEYDSSTAAAAAVISTSTMTIYDKISIDIDGAGTGAKGLKVWLNGNFS